MTSYGHVHIDCFDACPTVKRGTDYEEFKAAVLKAGRFSCFEANANNHAAKMYTRLCRDSGIVTDHESVSYPWTLVRLATPDEIAARRREQGYGDPADEEYLQANGWLQKHEEKLGGVYWTNPEIGRDGYDVALALRIQRKRN